MKTMELTFFILLLSFTGVSATVSRNLHCITRSNETSDFNEICDGQEVTCFCTAASNELIQWWPLPMICTITQLCNSCEPGFGPAVRAEVIHCPSCLDSFTSRLRYNVSLGMESCRRDVQIGCFITPRNSSMSAPIDSNTCNLTREPSDLEQNHVTTKLVTNCTVPGPPRNLQSVIQAAQCNSELRNVTVTWEAPEPWPSQLPVTHYNLSCTSGEGESCNETLPAETTSYNLTVDAGVQYTITVSALSNGRESCFNPHLNFIPTKVVSDNVAENNATIELQNGTFTSNLTITYGLCSEAFSWITLQFRPPVVHLMNLTADAMYCYSIIYNRNNTTVDDSCSGTFNTSSSSIQGCFPGDLWNLPAADANFLSDVSLLNDAAQYPSCDAGSVGSAVLVNTKLNTATVAYYNGTTPNSSACFVCDESSGYELNTTIDKRVCQSDGRWSESPIACDATESKLSTGAIVGIVLAAIVALLAGVLVSLFINYMIRRYCGGHCTVSPNNGEQEDDEMKEMD